MGIEAQTEEREIMSGDEEGKTITAENIAITEDVEVALVKLEKWITDVAEQQIRDMAELEDTIAAYRAEGSRAERRHDAVVDILLDVIGRQSDELEELGNQ